MAAEVQRPRIAISMGDPAGIGPEIVLRAICTPEIWQECVPVLVGSPAVFEATAERFDLPATIRVIENVAQAAEGRRMANVIASSELRDGSVPQPGETSPLCGRLAYEAIDRAVELILAGELDALCTAPISKAALNAAGYTYPGHTELLAEKSHSPLVAMLMVGGGIRVVPATIHCPLASVPSLLTSERIAMLLDLIHRSMADFAIERPRIAVCGLNPHAGEDGLLGNEEKTIIGPAIEQARNAGLNVTGPFPADVVYHQMLRGKWDVVLAMYHDQAMIAIKTVAFDRGVNVTLGLPFVRTSPDHGTAFDIAARGVADPSSIVEALKLAAYLTRNRRRRESSE